MLQRGAWGSSPLATPLATFQPTLDSSSQESRLVPSRTPQQAGPHAMDMALPPTSSALVGLASLAPRGTGAQQSSQEPYQPVGLALATPARLARLSRCSSAACRRGRRALVLRRRLLLHHVLRRPLLGLCHGPLRPLLLVLRWPLLLRALLRRPLPCRLRFPLLPPVVSWHLAQGREAGASLFEPAALKARQRVHASSVQG